ncbi:NUDIX domain-containing protein [uncultured Aquincola sp.]|uniref:NUDIX hydrolase n=1 Tax=uncultured Aquincola sp. TaxID=886556 RepID=UPI0032B2E712
MTAPMISFSASDWRFNLRAAGVLRHADFVLLHRLAGDAFWALPGGRVEMGETAEAAVRREMREELGTDVDVGRLLAVVENLYTYRDRPHHGIEMYFAVSLRAGSPLAGCAPFERVEEGGMGLDGVRTPGSRLQFQWFRAGELSQVDLRPSFLRHFLAAGDSQGVRHIVHEDRTITQRRPPA